ncbi:MAG: choice-of-anchor J domain-containing protein [Bacteroidales bacterium]|nr:choice-of-anchor J domain-containing protein [Bacteroidales bacterium]
MAIAALCIMSLLTHNVAAVAQKNCEKGGNPDAIRLEARSAALPKAPSKTLKFQPIGPHRTMSRAFVRPQTTLRHKSPLRLPSETIGNQPFAIGSVYASDGWTSGAEPFGPYAIGLQSYAVERMAEAGDDGIAASFYYDGKYFMATTQYSWIFYNGMHIEVFDAETWERLSSETLKIDEFSLLDAKWNPADNFIYGCKINGESYEFGTFDPTDYSFSPIVSLGGNGFVGFDIYDSVGYGINQYGDLYSIDLYTGAIKLIGATDLSIDTKTSAVIDPDTGMMYFLTNGGTSSLYEISLVTGKASKVYDLTANERIVGLSIPHKTAGEAPAAVTDLNVTAIGATPDCNMSFKIPSVKYDGSPATGDVKYTISANGKAITSGTAACGSTVNTQVRVDGTALYTFAVVLENQAGRSPARSVKVFIGEDTPKPSGSVTLERTAPDCLTLSWETPAAANGGYIDVDALTYDITDVPGNIVKSGVKGNSCDIEFVEPEVLTAFQYSVIANYKGETLAPVWSDILYFGNIKPPYSVSFADESSLDSFTIIDANKDDEKWLWYNGIVRCPYSNELAMDDWLITPGIILEAGKTYGLATMLSCMMSSCPERIEIKLGTAPTVDAMTIDVMEPTVIENSSEQAYEANITVDRDGIYYIGFHGISEPGQFFLQMHGFELMPPVESLLPAKVSDLTVTPDRAGAKTALISFTAPAKTVSGTALSTLHSGVIMRDGDVIETIANPVPGKKYSFEDKDCKGGMTEYSVCFENEIGKSESVSAQAFVGINIPEAITEASARKGDIEGSVVITWTEVKTDIDGKTLPAGTITYEVVSLEGDRQVPVATGLTTNTYTIENAYDPDGKQIFSQWGVFPVDEAGSGDGMATNGLILGADYPLPFTESFADAKLSYLWFVEADQSVFGAQVSVLSDDTFSDVSSQDGDNGLLAITADYSGSSASILSGNIDLEVTAPVLTFYSFGIREDNTNEIAVSVNSGNGWELVKTIVINGGMSWNRYRVDLSAFAGKTVRIKLQGTLTGATAILIDNISITQAVDYDLAVSSIMAPTRVKPGETATVKVKVENFGSYGSGSYTLMLYADGKPVGTVDGDAIAVDGNRTHEFTIDCNATTPDALDVYAQIVYGADEVADNNMSEHVTISVPKPNFPAPDGLTAAVDGNSVTLDWSRVVLPEFTAAAVVEDFEDAVSFAHDVFGWTMVDVDGGFVGGIDGVDIPGIEVKHTKSSFFVFDNYELGANSNLNARSGDKCLATLFNYDDSQIDDWAISPELSGDAQTISFYAKSFHNTYLEKIEIYYTKAETTDPADFVKIEGAGGTVPSDWTQFSADLPAGARHFAIRSCETGSFILLVDDISYNGYRGTELNHIGYNVYDNGVKANDAVLTAETCVLDNLADGSHTFHVTALYQEGESRASEPVTTAVSHVADAVADGISITVAGNEVVITGAAGHEVSVAAPDGRIVAAVVASDCCRLRLAGGVYIVAVGDKTVKVAVK